MENKHYKAPLSHQVNPGHSACAGCGMIMAARLLLDAAGPNTIVTNATGCSEVTTTQYPMTVFKMPWIHSLFENSSSIASGILAALKVKGLADETNIIAIGGDGATFDIGLGLISGMWERGENILYVCYDNEAYQNTGYQSSGSTPLDANTTTTPPGKQSYGSQQAKKDMIQIALAHHLPYVATATMGYPLDLTAKVKKALSIKGPKYLQIYTSCVPGWGIEPKDSLNVARAAIQSGFYPIVEYINGELSSKMKITKKIPVEDFLKMQKRFKHLFTSENSKKEIAKIQEICDNNIKKFVLTD
ncbi:MAG: thiamine pyrophosphate-dependent enzyme [Candidatus Buchananbacteria bacterium]